MASNLPIDCPVCFAPRGSPCVNKCGQLLSIPHYRRVQDLGKQQAEPVTCCTSRPARGAYLMVTWTVGQDDEKVRRTLNQHEERGYYILRDYQRTLPDPDGGPASLVVTFLLRRRVSGGPAGEP